MSKIKDEEHMVLEQQIKNLIIEYRNQYQNLNQKAKEESGFIRFESPLQAELIWIERRKHDIDFQILVFTNFSDIEDLEIKIHGPLKFKNRDNYIQKLVEASLTGKWARRKFPNIIKVSKEEPDELPYTKIFENIIADAKDIFFTFFNDYLLTDQFEELPYIFPGSRVYKEVFYWIIFGNLEDLNIEEYSKNQLIKYQKIKERSKELEILRNSPKIQKKLEEQKIYEINGYGTYFYPPLWIGELPDQSIGDKLTHQTVGSYVKNIIRTTYKGRTLLVQNDGYLAIGENDEESAIELINEIMGTAILYDIGVYVIRKSEVGRTTIDTRTWNISYSTPPNSKNQILEKERRKMYRSQDKIMRTLVTQEKLENVFKEAEKITMNTDIKTYLWLFLESFTFFYETVYTQSFLMSWFIFEKMLNNRCKELIEKINLEYYLKDYLENNNWTPDIMIKAIRIAEEIDNNEFFYFMDCKDHRNCIIHENIRSNYETVDKFRRFCIREIKKLINSVF